MNYDEGGLIGTYVSQFGLPMGKGRTYLEQIVALDVENEFRTDCEMYVKVISRRHGITATAVKQAIGRFLSKGWNMGYVEGWKKLIRWEKEAPPETGAAIFLICRNYRAFAKDCRE